MLGNRSHVATYVAALVTIVVVFVTVDHPIITANIADSIAGVIIFMPLHVSFKSALITFAVTLSVIYVIAHRASLAAFVTFAVAAAVKAMRHSHVKLRAAKVTRLVTIRGRTMRNMLASFSTVSTGSVAWAFIFVVGAISHRQTFVTFTVTGAVVDMIVRLSFGGANIAHRITAVVVGMGACALTIDIANNTVFTTFIVVNVILRDSHRSANIAVNVAGIGISMIYIFRLASIITFVAALVAITIENMFGFSHKSA
jgi:hypothetical protein